MAGEKITKEAIEIECCLSQSGKPLQFDADNAGTIKFDFSSDQAAQALKLLTLSGKTFKVRISE